MLPVHRRLAELWMKKNTKGLTSDEDRELRHCLTANQWYVWKLAKLENLSLLASMTNDTKWQHEICAEIDSLTSYN